MPGKDGMNTLKRIEFIGTSGVGKTTLFKELVKRRTRKDLWITPEEATVQIAKALTFDGLRAAREKIFFGILKANIFKKRHYGLAKRILNDTREKAFWEVGTRYNLLFDLQLRSIIEKTDIEPRLKSTMVSFYLNLAREVILFDYCKVKQVVVFDDGVMHNNGSWHNLDVYMQQVNPEYQSTCVLDPLGVVFCKSDCERIFRQAKNRLNENKGTFLHKNLSDDQLYARIERSMLRAGSVIENLKRRKVPVLEINTTEDQNRNTKSINVFIRGLST